VNVKLKVGDLIRPKEDYSYTNIRTGISTWLRGDYPPCILVEFSEDIYPVFHCSWNNELLLLDYPALDWCEVLNMRKEE